MVSDKELKDQDWDSYGMKEASFDGVKPLAVKWIDNGSVTVLSSFDSFEPVKTVNPIRTVRGGFLPPPYLRYLLNY